jgi:glycosyltransferase involved in cell wall biosynthesis
MNGFSLVIPAHNESAVIERTLRSVLASRLDRELQVIVVANGCTDDTAAKAGAFGPPVQVIQTAIGNKAEALNLGDRAARFFPRAFMDADVEVSAGLLQAVADAFADGGCRLVAPDCRHVYGGWNPFLAGYYALWRSMPYVRRDTTGRGFYAIDRELRSRFERFGPLLADDRFVHNLAKPSERRVVSGGHTTVRMPPTLRQLLRVKTRWTIGNLQLARARPDLSANDQEKHGGAAGHLLMRPWLWPHVPLFLFVYWYSQRAARRGGAQDAPGWERAQRNGM